MLQLHAPSSVALIAGKSRSGKTTFAVRYLIANQKLNCRFIFDPEGEYSQRLELIAAENEEQMGFAVEDGFALFNPHLMFPGAMGEAFKWFCKFCFETSTRIGGRNCVLIDEAWKYCSPNAIPSELSLILQTGGKRGLGSLFLTQRPNRLNEAITNEVTECVSFRLQGENAIKRIETDFGIEAEEIRALPLGSFVAVNVNSGGELRGKLF